MCEEECEIVFNKKSFSQSGKNCCNLVLEKLQQLKTVLSQILHCERDYLLNAVCDLNISCHYLKTFGI